MPTPTVDLRPVTKENWRECINLKLSADQESFVSSNLFSLAQSKFETCRNPCAIYNDKEEMVGFVGRSTNRLATANTDGINDNNCNVVP